MRKIHLIACALFAAGVWLPGGAFAQQEQMLGEITRSSGRDSRFEFKTPDGDKGYLETYEGDPSLYLFKGPHRHVVKGVTSLRFRSAQKVGAWTMILLESQSPNCRLSYQIVGLFEYQIRSWSFGNCIDRPTVELNQTAANFSIGAGASAVRANFVDGYFFKMGEDTGSTGQKPMAQPPVSVDAKPALEQVPEPSKLDFKNKDATRMSPKLINLD